MTMSREIMQGMYGEDMMNFLKGSISKDDILRMLNKELDVCNAYHILSLKTGLKVAIGMIEALPITYKSIVVKPMVIRMLEEQLALNQSYQLQSNLKGIQHAIGMVRLLDGSVA